MLRISYTYRLHLLGQNGTGCRSGRAGPGGRLYLTTAGAVECREQHPAATDGQGGFPPGSRAASQVDAPVGTGAATVLASGSAAAAPASTTLCALWLIAGQMFAPCGEL